MSGVGRFCCKSLFALVIKISFGCTSDFRVKMRGTSSPEDKLAGDLGNVIEATSTGGRRSEFFTAEKLAPGNFGLSQQYRHFSDVPAAPTNVRFQDRLGGISKRGNQYLRRLLINGASANLLRSKATNADPWVIGLRQRRPSLVVAVALANKTARIAWAVMHRHENYQRVAAAA
jgi:hypothetical protein